MNHKIKYRAEREAAISLVRGLLDEIGGVFETSEWDYALNFYCLDSYYKTFSVILYFKKDGFSSCIILRNSCPATIDQFMSSFEKSKELMSSSTVTCTNIEGNLPASSASIKEKMEVFAAQNDPDMNDNLELVSGFLAVNKKVQTSSPDCLQSLQGYLRGFQLDAAEVTEYGGDFIVKRW